jgi:transposase-like protein
MTADELIRWIEVNGTTIKGTAKELGIGETTLHNWISGRGEIPPWLGYALGLKVLTPPKRLKARKERANG